MKLPSGCAECKYAFEELSDVGLWICRLESTDNLHVDISIGNNGMPFNFVPEWCMLRRYKDE